MRYLFHFSGVDEEVIARFARNLPNWASKEGYNLVVVPIGASHISKSLNMKQKYLVIDIDYGHFCERRGATLGWRSEPCRSKIRW